MKKKTSALLLLVAVLMVPALGDAMPDSVAKAISESELAEKYFSSPNPVLTEREMTALSIAKHWDNGASKDMKPFPGPNGSITFVYGVHQPSIVCAVLQVCDVALQPGELVNSIHLGDSVRWTVEPAITGSGPTETQHLIIKPLDVGLETSLLVSTNRRAYHLKLRSHRTEYMPQVTFSYPDEIQDKWDAIRVRQYKEHQENVIPKTGEYLGDLSFEYNIEGTVAWKPLRVYNDGTKTIIEMPKAMEQDEAPSLLVVREGGGLFMSDETVMVNYRVQNRRYIVDMVFDKAILVAGVGRSQERVTITRRK